MAITDNFNSYSTGDLNGQGSWSGSTSFDVSTTSPQEGANCVENLAGGTTTYDISKSFTAIDAGSQLFYMKMSDTVGDLGQASVVFLSGTQEIATVRMAEQNVSGTKFRILKDGGGEADLGSKSTSWRLIEVEWDASTDGVRARVDGGSWSSWITDGTSFSSIDKVTLRKITSAGGVDYYWDKFYSGFSTTITETASVAETSLVAKGKIFSIAEVISLTEIKSVAKGKLFSILETLSLSDTADSIIRWIRQNKNTVAWSNNSKNTSSTSNQSKNTSNWSNQNKT